MGNKNDGKNEDMLVEGWPDGQKPFTVKLEKDIAKFGNTEAKILAKAYEEFSKDGLTIGEFKKLKKIDDALESVELDLVGSKSAHLIQQDANLETDFLLTGADVKKIHELSNMAMHKTTTHSKKR